MIMKIYEINLINGFEFIKLLRRFKFIFIDNDKYVYKCGYYLFFRL